MALGAQGDVGMGCARFSRPSCGCVAARLLLVGGGRHGDGGLS